MNERLKRAVFQKLKIHDRLVERIRQQVKALHLILWKARSLRFTSKPERFKCLLYERLASFSPQSEFPNLLDHQYSPPRLRHEQIAALQLHSGFIELY